jgi:phosphoribosylaminoimidazolecarboxamide formyltransferase/IMP cyclohydrolase
MLRAAAKNFRHVAVLVDPMDYPRAIDEISRTGSLSEAFRFELAKKAFRHVAAYDTAIFAYLSRLRPDGTLSPEAAQSPYPDKLTLEFFKIQDLRYGENPHQSAGFYREISATGPSIASAMKLQGKELSFNNIVDLDAALALVAEFEAPACAIIKHNNPCGVGLGETAEEAYGKALETDPISAYGGVIGFNVPVEREAATAILPQFIEAIVAPSFTSEAQEILAAKKHIRLLEVGALRSYGRTGLDLKRVNGGILAQEWDRHDAAASDLKVVSRRAPTADEMQAMRFAWKIAKHVRSNAIVYAAKDRTLGIGAGQMSRVDSARLGAEKARGSLSGSALASDAFFPFRDGLDEAAARGVTAIIQPGGSIRDDETIAAADEHDMAMVFTGYRHFRH